MNDLKFMDRNTPDLPADVVAAALDQHYGLNGDLTGFPSERDQNTRVITESDTFLFKICNIDEDPAVVDFQIQALQHIASRDGDLNIPRHIPSTSGDDTVRLASGHQARLMSYVAGDMVRSHPEGDGPDLLRSTGTILARLNLALGGFFHPAADQDHPWKMMPMMQLLPFVDHIADASARRNVHRIFERLRDEVIPRTERMRHQVVHQDAHTGNLVVDPADHHTVTGIIDFGDMVHAPLIMDLTIAADLSGRPHQDPEAVAELVMAYDRVLPLTEDEVDVFYDWVLGRMAMTAAIVAGRAALHPEVEAYHDGETQIWERIEAAMAAAPAAHQTLRRATRFPMTGIDTESLRTDRERVMGKHSPHFYRQPLHVERAEGVWMFGADGKRYLDFYNNVPTVGHSHPHVVNAISRQLTALNTHTRYVYNNAVEYADRLTSSLSDDLDVCLFVNSGSEANDVAWQISQMVTSNDGLLVMRQAYHGITQAGIAMTTAKGLNKADHVEEIPAPDDYRSEPSTAEGAMVDTRAAIERLAGRGHDVGAFIVDSAMCSSGIPGYPRRLPRRDRHNRTGRRRSRDRRRGTSWVWQARRHVGPSSLGHDPGHRHLRQARRKRTSHGRRDHSPRDPRRIPSQGPAVLYIRRQSRVLRGGPRCARRHRTGRAGGELPHDGRLPAGRIVEAGGTSRHHRRRSWPRTAGRPRPGDQSRDEGRRHPANARAPRTHA